MHVKFSSGQLAKMGPVVANRSERRSTRPTGDTTVAIDGTSYNAASFEGAQVVRQMHEASGYFLRKDHPAVVLARTRRLKPAQTEVGPASDDDELGPGHSDQWEDMSAASEMSQDSVAALFEPDPCASPRPPPKTTPLPPQLPLPPSPGPNQRDSASATAAPAPRATEATAAATQMLRALHFS